MFIPAVRTIHATELAVQFQSLDWVDVYSGMFLAGWGFVIYGLFQSLDWVDVYSGPTAR